MINVIRGKIRTINGKAITEDTRDYNITLGSKAEYDEFRKEQVRLVKLEYDNENTTIFLTYKTK